MDITQNINKLRNDFPALNQKINNYPLVYFDNAATTLKPRQVVDAVSEYYLTINSNVHRGVHTLSQQATDAFEESRKVIQQFLNAANAHEIIFTRGTTESLNLLSMSLGKMLIRANDEVIVTGMEHHANLVPWQVLCGEKNARLKILPVDENGGIDYNQLKEEITESTRLISVTHVSNVLGTVNPVKKIIEIAHEQDIPVIIDGAQAVSHISVDVQDLDCDFYCFSGHKCYGPMGTGVLFGKEKWLERMPPFLTGGEMVKSVDYQKAVFNDLPYKFEAGTPDVAGAIGLAEALRYLTEIGLKDVAAYENQLLQYSLEKLRTIKSFRMIGTQAGKAPVISFNLEGIHHYDAGTILDKFGIAVRTGTHCAQPLVEHFGHTGTIRASLAFYNINEEIDRLVEALRKIENMFLC